MAKETKIAWATSTFNGWIGCAFKSSGNSSPACERCYAETWAKRMGRDFSVPKLTSDAYWKKPIQWNKEAAERDEPWRVFAFSMGDVFDPLVPDDPLVASAWRNSFFSLVEETPNLTWMVLTKQSKKMKEYMQWFYMDDEPLANLWLGVTVEHPDYIWRIEDLLQAPAAVRFVSVEPMLEDLDIKKYLVRSKAYEILSKHYGSSGFDETGSQPERKQSCLDWVICGAETGPGARPMDPAWARSLKTQCEDAGVPFFMKQMSNKEPIPDDLMIREFPGA